MPVPVLVLAMVLAGSGLAAAHPDHPDPGSDRGGRSRDDFPGEGVGFGKQHGGTDGHLPPVRRNVTLVGKAEVTNPSGAGNTGRVGDVFGYGDYAYLNAYFQPTCEAGGVHVMDISNPAAPVEVTSAFIPTSAGSYAGEGIQVIPMANQYFTGDLLIHNNETCGPPPDPASAGGISLWNVTSPRSPQPVALHQGDFTNPAGGPDASPNQTHSMYAWTNDFDRHTYVVLVDDEELTDLDILDITNPFSPVLVNDTLDLNALFGVGQERPPNLTQIFSHDMVVQKVGQRYVMNANYWDGGYVLLDVTNPTPGNVSLIVESDYAQLDEERLERGQRISPEGNAHQSELSPDRRFLIGTDEDFNPFRLTAKIDTGRYRARDYQAVTASGTPPVTPARAISGPTTFVGTACGPLAPGTGTALVERGTCSFQAKLDNVAAAGYSAGIVFNSVRPDCQSLVRMLAEGDIPFLFVSRLTGLQLLGVLGVNEASACTTPSPAPGSPSAATTIKSVFDGWGYVRLFVTAIPSRSGARGAIRQIDTYSIPEAQDPAFATGFGDLSVHEVAMDPVEPLAYISYYAGGFRVVNYGPRGLQEVGAFIDEGGNNFWGVEVWHDENGEKYVLASDRDLGLYIFQYTPGSP